MYSIRLLLTAAVIACCCLPPTTSQAAVIDRVTVISPDSGQVRGIDSLIVVEAAVRATQLDSGLAVFFWLVEDGVDSLVLADTTAFGVPAITDSIKAAIGAGAGHFAARAPASFVAGRRAKQAGLTPVIGDGDSITFRTKTSPTGFDSLLFTWHVRVPASAGTFLSVRAAAMVHDPLTAPTFSSIAVSPPARPFAIDGDRPAQGTMALNAVTTGGGVAVTGFSVGGTRTVLGIGDTVHIDYNLGSTADGVILFADSLRLVASVHNRTFDLRKPGAAAAKEGLVVKEGDFGDLPDPASANSDTVTLHVVDRAGNWSSAGVDDARPFGVNAPVSFVIDARRPLLDGQVAPGDTVILAAGDTLSDGTLNSGFAHDVNPIVYNLAEALDSLLVQFSGLTHASAIFRSGRALDNPSLKKAADAADSRRLDITRLGRTTGDTLKIARLDGSAAELFSVGAGNLQVIRGGDSLLTGLYRVSLLATDLAGNVGFDGEVVRDDVYLDMDDVELVRLFPTAAAGVDTINAQTAAVVFRLDEPADSVLITYRGIGGADTGALRRRSLVGAELVDTATERVYAIEGLQHDSQYELTVLARDLAGNFVQSGPDTFYYDTTFTVGGIDRFSVVASQRGLGQPLLAGQELTLTLQALTAEGRNAVSYRGEAELRVDEFSGTQGVRLVADNGKSTGVTQTAEGRFALNVDGWVNGRRSVVVQDVTAADTLLISVNATVDGGAVSGQVDSLVYVVPQTYSQILLRAPELAVQGEPFWVEAVLADSFGNRRAEDDRFIEISADKVGVEAPTAVYVEGGLGGFWAVGKDFSGADLHFVARDAAAVGVLADSLAAGGPQDKGGHHIVGVSNAVEVLGAFAAFIDAPDGLEGSDYKGADGQGDQGGFVLLSFDLSTDHETLTGYRIWRQIQVAHRIGESGAPEPLPEGEAEAQLIPWGVVDAVPGVDGLMHVVVATLDNAATSWAVSAERGRATTFGKRAVAAVAGGPYELMARTVQQSRQQARLAGGPVVALLTPEAMAYGQQGVVPRFKTAGDAVLRSARTFTAVPLGAVDDVAPLPVPGLTVRDAPGDAGGRVALRWGLSPSDRLLSQTASRAVGGGAFTTPGVAEYRVYRQQDDDALLLIGKTAAGAEGFVDEQAFNGVSYRYEVRPFDGTQEGAAVAGTGMAVRDRVFDGDGQPLPGLVGPNGRVDFDDFFVVADRFGQTLDDAAFEPAVDLVADNRIDREDLQVLGRHFGRHIGDWTSAVPSAAEGVGVEVRLAPPASPEADIEVTLRLDAESGLTGYGLVLRYDAAALQFAGLETLSGLPGEDVLNQGMLLSEQPGQVVLAGHAVQTAKEVALVLRWRPLGPLAGSQIQLSEGVARVEGRLLPLAGQKLQVETLPGVFALAKNFPNPFNPQTTIGYELPVAGPVRLEVFNAAGQRVRTLVDQVQAAGRYAVEWDGDDDGSRGLGAGVYFYRLEAGEGFGQVRKMLLLK